MAFGDVHVDVQCFLSSRDDFELRCLLLYHWSRSNVDLVVARHANLSLYRHSFSSNFTSTRRDITHCTLPKLSCLQITRSPQILWRHTKSARGMGHYAFAIHLQIQLPMIIAGFESLSESSLSDAGSVLPGTWTSQSSDTAHSIFHSWAGLARRSDEISMCRFWEFVFLGIRNLWVFLSFFLSFFVPSFRPIHVPHTRTLQLVSFVSSHAALPSARERL